MGVNLDLNNTSSWNVAMKHMLSRTFVGSWQISSAFAGIHCTILIYNFLFCYQEEMCQNELRTSLKL